MKASWFKMNRRGAIVSRFEKPTSFDLISSFLKDIKEEISFSIIFKIICFKEDGVKYEAIYWSKYFNYATLKFFYAYKRRLKIISTASLSFLSSQLFNG